MLDHCRSAQTFAEREEFRILFLDKRKKLIADKVQQTGTVDHTPTYPREVIKRAREVFATAISWCTITLRAIRRRRRQRSR